MRMLAVMMLVGCAPGQVELGACEGDCLTVQVVGADTDLEVGPTATVDRDLDGWTTLQGDCDDESEEFSPEGSDTFGDGFDQNCDGTDGMDDDQDGVASTESGGGDCDDLEASIHPGAEEIWYDGIDQQCDGVIADCDQDGDGRCRADLTDIPMMQDCDDLDPRVFPEAFEAFDGIDNNCNGLVDQFGVTVTWESDTQITVQVQDYVANTATVTLQSAYANRLTSRREEAGTGEVTFTLTSTQSYPPDNTQWFELQGSAEICWGSFEAAHATGLEKPCLWLLPEVVTVR